LVFHELPGDVIDLRENNSLSLYGPWETLARDFEQLSQFDGKTVHALVSSAKRPTACRLAQIRGA
jgi:hypothetical protein